MLKQLKYAFLFIIIIGIGIAVEKGIIDENNKAVEREIQEQLIKDHHQTVIRIESGINVYATLVSSIRAYLQNSSDFPTQNQLQSYLKDLIRDLDFKDSIIVSWVDTNEVFRYSVTPYVVDPAKLAGTSVKKLRPKKMVDKLDALMHKDSITLFDPINLFEGFAAFPFDFSARDSKGKILGYIAPVIDVKYLLNHAYKGNNDTTFLHRFAFNDSIDISRERIYDGTKYYGKSEDKEYYGNYNVSKTDFIYSELHFYGLKLKVGTMYKKKPEIKHTFQRLVLTWYITLTIVGLYLIFQLVNSIRGNFELQKAHAEIQLKNKELEERVSQIKSLIREIHHRVKNNMQIISSLLSLQQNEELGEVANQALEISRNRISAMALVHQKLYGIENLSQVNAQEYIKHLSDSICTSFQHLNSEIKIEIIINPNIFLDVDTVVPLGLIINECMTNSFKYAFLDRKVGLIKIELLKDEVKNGIRFSYYDNGPGIPDTFNWESPKSLGVELVKILTDQLNGSYEYSKIEGSEFIIRFPLI